MSLTIGVGESSRTLTNYQQEDKVSLKNQTLLNNTVSSITKNLGTIATNLNTLKSAWDYLAKNSEGLWNSNATYFSKQIPRSIRAVQNRSKGLNNKIVNDTQGLAVQLQDSYDQLSNKIKELETKINDLESGH